MTNEVTKIAGLDWILRKPGLQNAYALGFGIFLIALGVWCLFVSAHVFPPFSIMTCNAYHGAISLLFGLSGVVAGMRRHGTAFNLYYGVVFTTLFITYLIPETRAIQAAYLNSNWPMAVFHLVAGIMCFGVYGAARQERSELVVSGGRLKPLAQHGGQ